MGAKPSPLTHLHTVFWRIVVKRWTQKSKIAWRARVCARARGGGMYMGWKSTFVYWCASRVSKNSCGVSWESRRFSYLMRRWCKGTIRSAVFFFLEPQQSQCRMKHFWWPDIYCGCFLRIYFFILSGWIIFASNNQMFCCEKIYHRACHSLNVECLSKRSAIVWGHKANRTQWSLYNQDTSRSNRSSPTSSTASRRQTNTMRSESRSAGRSFRRCRSRQRNYTYSTDNAWFYALRASALDNIDLTFPKSDDLDDPDE